MHHNNECIKHDLKSTYVLISNDYLYFGKNAIDIPYKLTNIIPTSRGHKSKSIESLEENFNVWFKLIKNKYKGDILGTPHNILTKCVSKKSEN